VLGVSSPSVTLHETVVVPTANIDPDARLQVTGGEVASSSIADGGVKLTAAPDDSVATAEMSAGTAVRARSVSFTVTANVAVRVLACRRCPTPST